MEYTDYPRGTGSMTAALRDGTLDVAVALTEGLVAGICFLSPDLLKAGPCYHIVGEYVHSPLNWGIAVHPDSNIKSVADLEGLSSSLFFLLTSP